MKRVIYAEGEDERVLRAAQVVLEEGLAKPILIGRPEVIETRIKRFGLTIKAGRRFRASSIPRTIPRYRDYVATYLEAAGRKGVTPDAARTVVRTSPSVIGALAVRRGEADALICGLEGRFTSRLDHIRDIIGLAPGINGLLGAVAASSLRRASISSPTRMFATTRARRRSPRWRSPAPRMCAASASSPRSR